MSTEFLFTSEQVSLGHPDKMSDYISDSLLDEYLKQDPDTKFACETATKNNMVMVFGEINSKAKVNVEQVVRNACKEIGYDNWDIGFDYKTCEVINNLDIQSPEIANAVHVKKEDSEIGAGDQGLMMGYATNETTELMPLTYVYSTLILKYLHSNKNKFDWLRPDCKSQVTIKYIKENGVVKPLKIHTILLSLQHSEKIKTKEIHDIVMKEVIPNVIDPKYLDENTKYIINPSDSFIIGGPRSDAGLTGRKIIADTYGGWGGHGGGAFSGKDSSKVDRSGAYAARWIAKSLVSSKLCDRCLVQVSYGIGLADPISIFVDSFGTSKNGDGELIGIIKKNFDLRPGMIIRDLELKKPIFKDTCSYGHFMPKNIENKWEIPKNLKK